MTEEYHEKPAPHPGGRPTKYKPEFVEQARKLCQLGATDYEVADFFDVDPATVHRWKHAHPEFCEAMKLGKDAPDDRVERSLYNRAVGYTFPAEKVFCHEGDVTRVEIVEHVPPDPRAALNWLKNRKPDTWRDKHEIDHGVTDSLKELMTEIDGKSKPLVP